MIFSEYPKSKVIRGKKELSFRVLGSHQMACKMRVVSKAGRYPDVTITASRQGRIIESQSGNGQIEYIVYGDQKINVRWK